MRPLLFLLLFAACIPVTYRASIRRMAEHQLKTCRHGTTHASQYVPCYKRTQEYCRNKGLEPTCGEGAQ